MGYLRCRESCAIQLEESVIITGGVDSGGGYPYSRVQQYSLAGSMGRLPDLNTGRQRHACGKYIQNGEVVSSNIKSIVIVIMCLWCRSIL